MEYKNNIPIYIQVTEDIKRKIFMGEISVGEKLPSNNELALMYKINPNTVQRIYKELELEGICYVKRGVGTFVCENSVLPERLKKEMVIKTVKHFLNDMKSFGYSPEEASEIIIKFKGEGLC